MRYGKIYSYDRFGNREPTESDRVRAALDNFDAPRFRPPENMTLGKNYTRQFSPLETPPPFNQDDPTLGTSRNFIAADNDPLMGRSFNVDLESPGFPPRVPMANVHPPFQDIEKFRMDDVEKDPKFHRLEPPRTLNPLVNVDIGEQIGPSIDRGIMIGAAEKLRKDMEELDIKRERYSDHEGLDHFRKEVYYEEQGDICAQCRLEEKHLARLKAETEGQIQKQEDAARKAQLYETEVAKKEREACIEAEERKRRLMDHVDRVNEEILEEHRLRRRKSPPQDYYIFRRENDNLPALEKGRKEIYARDLAKQIEERRLRLVDEHERQEALDAASNSRAAKEYAASREAVMLRREHDQDLQRKQLELQMEMQRKAPPVDDKWLWWTLRPDEHGWRAARIEKHSNQMERNEQMKNNINRLEEFKHRQTEMDSEASQARRAKYAMIRERLHENSELVHGTKKEEDKRLAAIGWQPNPLVEAAWRAAHERNDKKYRILQEGAAKSMAGAALGEQKVNFSCRRCIRCHRLMAHRREIEGVVSQGQMLWNAL